MSASNVAESSSKRRVAVVTGAASGIGWATAERLSADGDVVVCLDREVSGLDDRVAGLVGEAIVQQCDVTDETSVDAAVAAVRERFGVVDLLANVAGVATAAQTADVAIDEWQRILDVNLTGTFLMTQRFLPLLSEGGTGSVVNVASVAGLRGWRYMAAYSASKGGVVALSRSLAVEFGGRGVRVNCVCPGGVDTPLAAGLPTVPDADPALLQRTQPLITPAVAQPEEIAAAIAYLASPDARMMTGSVLVIDGGLLA